MGSHFRFLFFITFVAFVVMFLICLRQELMIRKVGTIVESALKQK